MRGFPTGLRSGIRFCFLQNHVILGIVTIFIFLKSEINEAKSWKKYFQETCAEELFEKHRKELKSFLFDFEALIKNGKEAK